MDKDDDSEDTPCDERKKKTSFQHSKKGSKRVDTIPVTNVTNNTKY